MRTLDPLALDGKVLPFRRPSAAVRVRRRSPWRRLAGPAAKALVLLGGPLAAGLWLLTSPTFALSRIELEGGQHVDGAWVERALAPLVGENLLRLSLPAVETVVRTNPWIAAVRLEKRLPDRLRVTVVERRPAALLRRGEGLAVIDDAGRVIAPWEPGVAAPDLLLVSVGTAGELELAGALEIADELSRAAPGWAATLSEVEVLSGQDYRLYLGAVPFPLLVRAGTLGERLPTLAALLPELERRYPALAAVDLRFRRRIVFQPIVERS